MVLSLSDYVVPASATPPSSSSAARNDGEAYFGLRMNLPANVAHNYTPLTPISFLLRAALIAPDSLAIVHPEKGVRLTYSQWAARTLCLTYAILATQGWSKGERVAVIAPNCPMILELHTAILAAGGIITPLK